LAVEKLKLIGYYKALGGKGKAILGTQQKIEYNLGEDIILKLKQK